MIFFLPFFGIYTNIIIFLYLLSTLVDEQFLSKKAERERDISFQPKTGQFLSHVTYTGTNFLFEPFLALDNTFPALSFFSVYPIQNIADMDRKATLRPQPIYAPAGF